MVRHSSVGLPAAMITRTSADQRSGRRDTWPADCEERQARYEVPQARRRADFSLITAAGLSSHSGTQANGLPRVVNAMLTIPSNNAFSGRTRDRTLTPIRTPRRVFACDAAGMSGLMEPSS